MIAYVAAINPEELLLAYRLGIFPMAESRTSAEILWVRPHERGIIPLETFHVPRRLARTVRMDRYRVTANLAFERVILACAEAREPERRETWINGQIVDVFLALHAQGAAHSIETWHENELVGGVYGLSLAGAFFAESKFSRMTDASKVALVHLAARLIAGNYSLLDAQFPNPHLEQFGAATISEDRFLALLAKALARKANFYSLGEPGATVSGDRTGAASLPSTGGARMTSVKGAGASVLQVIAQTS